MVSPQRRWEKIRRMESKIMAYEAMLGEGKVPTSSEVLGFHASRHGQPLMDIDKARAAQAKFDLLQDIKIHVKALELTFKDYLEQLTGQGLLDIVEAVKAIKDPAAKPKKEAKKKDA